MATFANTTNPTPFGFFDADSGFQTDADNMVTFVKRKLGDDVLSVELTKKQIWACFEEATLEYSSIINMHEAESTLLNTLGVATGSAVSGSFNIGPHGKEALLQRFNLDFASRNASAYSTEAFIGGDYNHISGSIQLVSGQQDYDIYTELKDASGTAITGSMSSPGKMRVTEVFHFDPLRLHTGSLIQHLLSTILRMSLRLKALHLRLCSTFFLFSRTCSVQDRWIFQIG
jgi:hypothetical protein